MHAAVHADASPLQDSPVTPRIALLRTSIGLLQGLLLYLLYRASEQATWPATVPLLFSPLVLIAISCPIILISGIGHMTRRQLLLWAGAASVIVAALAVYDIWRMGTGLHLEPGSRTALPSPVLCAALVAGLFIAHALVLSGAREKRRIASYASYFDVAWKLGVQLAFSGLFVGVTWLALTLGAELFSLVRIEFPSQLIRKPWFAIPVTAFAFSSAMHLTDVRPAIVQGIRSLLLTLLSWILPVFTPIVAAFLASLVFTGLEPLWGTRRAAAVLLGADAALVILINAAWQNGAAAATVARLVRSCARLAALLLVPVTGIAVYALALRVGDHGWTVERIIAAACMLVAGCYALGYAAAALRAGWLERIARVNIATAFVVLGVALLLFSPLADPARLSVNDQLARLAAGKVKATDFDFAYLRFSGKRFGEAALAQFEAGARGPDAALVRERIAAVRKMKGPWEKRDDGGALAPAVLAANLHAWPAGTGLPERFLATNWGPVSPFVPGCLRQAGTPCDAYLLDLSGDGKPEILLVVPVSGWSVVAQENGQGEWHLVARLQLPGEHCGQLRQAMRSGSMRTTAPALADIEIGGQRYRSTSLSGEMPGCPLPPPP
jgi:hypothetical protein